jgi:tricorn protease
LARLAGSVSAMTVPPAYLRYPAIHGDQVVFVTEDDLWTVHTNGGEARRLTADLLQVGRPSLSPDGSLVAFTSEAGGQPDVYVMPAGGGEARRLTWLGEGAVLGWAPDGRIVIASAAGQPFQSLAMAYALQADPAPGTAPEPLPYGPVGAVSYGPRGGVVIGRNTADPARWKRYRGGTAGALWIDPAGTGDWRPLLGSAGRDGQPGTGSFPGNLACPMWIGEHIWFLSDHEGIGNLYSCDPDGADLRRHTDHDEHYARWASTDGTRVVYQVAARLWLLDPAAGDPQPIQVEVRSPRTQRRRRFVDTDHNLGGWALDKSGERLALDVRGKLVSLGTWEGAVRQHGRAQGARYRLARFAGDQDLVSVSDEGGEEGVEVHPLEGEPIPSRLPVPELGRVVELVPSPDGRRLAITNHRNQLLVVERENTTTKVLDAPSAGRPGEPAWSPDGRWLAWASPASEHARQIRLANLEDESGRVYDVTPPRFHDSCPTFDPEGRWLCFLSHRTFDPVYDNLLFDMGFPKGVRPYLVTLHTEDPSPFLVKPKPAEAGDEAKEAKPPAGVRIDLEGLAGRAIPFPVPEARYERVALLPGTKALLLSRPVEGALSRDVFATNPPPNGTIELYDLTEGKHEDLVHDVEDFALSADGRHVAYATRSEDGTQHLRVLESGTKPPEGSEQDPAGKAGGWVDLGRVRVEMDPGAEWAQMLAEAWRLQREQFWAPDLSGVDWDRVLQRYLPLVNLVATRAELSDLIWEMQGELGTSHCYEIGGDYRPAPRWGVARLGADLAWDPEASCWRVSHLARGEVWETAEAPPLAMPGVGVRTGAAILAVNGQPVPAEWGPGPLLANQSGQPVELTVHDAGAPSPRRVLVPTLTDERPLRYREWVEANRDRVHSDTAGRAGYVHIPDMMAKGFAEFHRGYHREVERDALVIDARYNQGGHVSGLLLEKLARRRIGYDVVRWGHTKPYLGDSPAGPLVLLTNEWAGSDGDIFTHGFQMLGLGPVVGTRTWGGVIGIELTLPLVDGTVTTQPQYAYWFADVGWGVENHGADPDHMVVIGPGDYATGRDPQLEKGIELVLAALSRHEAPKPDMDNRPRLDLPRLPTRAES